MLLLYLTFFRHVILRPFALLFIFFVCYSYSYNYHFTSNAFFNAFVTPIITIFTFNAIVTPTITILLLMLLLSLELPSGILTYLFRYTREIFSTIFLNALCKPTLMLHWYPSFYILFTLSFPALTLLFFLTAGNVFYKYFFSLLIPQGHSLFTRVAHKLSIYFDFFSLYIRRFYPFTFNTLVIPRITIQNTYFFVTLAKYFRPHF